MSSRLARGGWLVSERAGPVNAFSAQTVRRGGRWKRKKRLLGAASWNSWLITALSRALGEERLWALPCSRGRSQFNDAGATVRRPSGQRQDCPLSPLYWLC